jgi:aminoglycoside phosphotransferase (APT) family kinase protein
VFGNAVISLRPPCSRSSFPQWADLPIEPVHSAGTDKAIYRLGDDMAVRLPRIHWATGQVDEEHFCPPRLGPLLPLAIPVPLANGMPAEGYPCHWSVCRWLAGENAIIEPIADLRQAAIALAPFVAALQRIDRTGGPPLERTTLAAASRSFARKLRTAVGPARTASAFTPAPQR